jgi:hypothetical protein
MANVIAVSACGDCIEAVLWELYAGSRGSNAQHVAIAVERYSSLESA